MGESSRLTASCEENECLHSMEDVHLLDKRKGIGRLFPLRGNEA
jgi:hypothetical protein